MAKNDKTDYKTAIENLKSAFKASKEMQENLNNCEKTLEQYLKEKDSQISWEKIEKLENDSIINYEKIITSSTCGMSSMLKKIIIVKLNGGLGTTMGCSGPKSTIKIKDDLTFLDLTVQQIEQLNNKYKSNVPLILMNSFNTQSDTEKIIKNYENKVEIYTFNQSVFPRLSTQEENYKPIALIGEEIEANKEAWYPPGHGDFYQAFHNSGLLEKFLNQGKKFVFLSNIDNLGATIDTNIVNLLLGHNKLEKCEFLMEVTDKTKADVKGGTLIRYEDKIRLLEVAQVPKNHLEEFKNIKTFTIFNTNNLWIDLQAIKNLIEENKLHMEVIFNPKVLKNGKEIVQLEIAVGAAIKCFNNPLGINVSRNRFLPVKKTSDLLLIMSDLFCLDQNKNLLLTSTSSLNQLPDVKLDERFFKKVDDFLKRFPSIPNIQFLDYLVIFGDVSFGKGVMLKGSVFVVCEDGKKIVLPSKCVLDNQIVTGNVQIHSL